MSGSSSDRCFDKNDALNDFAESYLLVNELLDAGSSTRNMIGDSGLKDLLVKTFSIMEYAVNSSPGYETKKLLVRGEQFLRRLQEHTSELNVDEIFSQATGLTLQDYQRLIFWIFAFYWNFTSERLVLVNFVNICNLCLSLAYASTTSLSAIRGRPKH